MATIKNIITTIFNSQGAGGVNRDLTTLSRNQTRLGQSSASAGRAFSAQASGLGGLVAAYAGAAATTFALQQAFDKLAKSAQAIQTLQGLNTLAAESAIGGQALLKSIQDITKGQLTLFEAASQTNLALSAGFDTAQIEGLSTVAIKASRALGRDLTDAMTRVVRGSAKMETELLDELGIYTKIEPATRAYAAAIGKSVTELTEYERRQAFVNSVIEEGTRKFSAINTTVPTAAESIEAFGAKMSELSTIFIGFLAEGVAPLADFLTNNFAASVGAVGLILSLVAGKGVALLKAGFEALAVSAAAAGRAKENNIRIYLGVADAAAKATAAVRALDAANIRGTTADKDRLATLQTEAKTRALTRRELLESQKIIQKNITAINAERDAYRASLRAAAVARGELDRARAMPRGSILGSFADPQERARNLAIAAANRSIRDTRAAALQAVQSLPALRVALTQTTAAYDSVTVAATSTRAAIAGAFSAAAAGAGVLISRLGALSGFFLGLAGKVLFAVTVVQLFGSAISNFLGVGEQFESFFRNLGKTISSALGVTKARELKQAITGIVGGSLVELEKTNTELANIDKFTFSQSKFLGIKIEVEKSKEDIIKEVTSILQEVQTTTEKTTADIATGALQGAVAGGSLGFLTGGFKGALVGAVAGGVIGGITSAFSSSEVDVAVKNFSDEIKAQYASSFANLNLGEQEQNAAVRAISVLRDRYGSAAAVDPQARAFLKVNEQLVLESAKYIKNIEEISTIMAATGQTAGVVSRNFNFDNAVAQIESLKLATTEIAGIEISVTVQTEKAREAFQNFALEEIESTQKSATIISKTLEESRIPTSIAQKAIQDSIGLTREQIRAKSISITTQKDLTQELIAESKALGIIAGNYKDLATLEQAVNLKNIFSGFTELAGSVDSANASLLRGVEILRSVDQEINSNSLSLEQFEQKISSASSALSQTRQGAVAANTELAELNTLLSTTDLDPEKKAILLAQRDSLQDQLRILKEQIPNYKQTYQLLKDQEEVLKSQIQLNDFIREQSSKALNPLSVALEAYTKNTDNAKAKTLEFVQAIAKSTEQEGIAYSKRAEELDKLALTPDQRASVLRATAETAESIATSLSRQAGITAIVKNGEILIAQTLEDQVVLKAIIGSMSADEVIKGQQNVELTQLQLSLVQDAVASSITLLSSQDAYLSKLRETNALKQQELELSLSTAQEEAKKQAAASSFERAQFDIDKVRQSVELEETRLEIAESLSSTAVSALERQITLQENIANREQASLARKIEAEQRTLGILQAQAEARELLVSIATPLDKQGSNEAAVFREQLNSRAQILAQETALIYQEERSEQARLESERGIAQLRVDQALKEQNAAAAQLASRSVILDKELVLLQNNQQLEQNMLAEQIRANESASTRLVEESKLRFAQLQAEQDLEIKRATDNATQLLAQLNVIQRQDEVNTKFNTDFRTTVELLQNRGLEQITQLPDSSAGLREDLETFKSKASEAYSAVFQLQRDVLDSELTTNSARLDSEEKLLADKKVALDSYQAEVINLAKQRLNAEVASLSEQLRQTQQNYNEQVKLASDNADRLIELDAEFNAQRAQSGQAFVNYLLNEYAKIATAAKQLVSDFKEQAEELNKQTAKLGQEVITIQVQAAFDAEQAASQLSEQLAEADISKFQAKIRLAEARADIKEISPVDAVKEINALQKQILAKQEEIELARFQREVARNEFERGQAVEEFARVKAEIEARRDLAIEEARARADSVNSMIAAFSGFINDNKAQWEGIISSLASVFREGAASIALSILSEGTASGAVSGASNIPGVTSLAAIKTDVEAAFKGVETAITANAAAQVDVEKAKTNAIIDQKTRELTAAEAGHKANLENLGIQKQTEEVLAKKRTQDAIAAGSAGSKAAKEAAEEALEASNQVVEAYKDISDKLRDSIRSIANELINFVGGIITSIAESKVKQLQAQETQLQDALGFSTEKLNDARSELEKSLDDEAGQREQLIELTKALTESQKSYIDSLGAQDKVIQESSNLYVEKLLEQKRAIIDLAVTTRRSVALSKQEQVLSKNVAGLQESLDSVTESRVRAEERLAQTQGLLQGVTDAVNVSSQGLSQSLLNMRSAMIALQEVLGIAGGGGIDIGQLQKQAGLQQAFGDLSSVVNNFKEGIQKLSTVNGNFVTASGKVVGNAEKISAGLSTAATALGGAQSGFGIGSTIAAALGKTGFATQVGGAIGGALGSVLTAGITGSGFLSGLAGSISGALGAGIAGALFSFALPVVGALIGSLFAKTPKSGATGAFDETGTFGIVSEYQKGGAKSEGLKNVITATFDSFFGSLEEVGITLSEEAKTFQFIITTRKKAMAAFFKDEARGIDMVESVADAKEASQFFVDSFLKTFERGDLIVDAVMPFAEVVQAAIDNFSTKPIEDRAQATFNAAIEFAQSFEGIIDSLRGPARSTAEAIDLIQQAAKSNADQLQLFYTRFLTETKDTLGESSEFYTRALGVVRQNALAQIGLAEITENGVKKFVSLSDAIQEVNSGSVLVADALDGIVAFQSALASINFSGEEIAAAIELAIDVAITGIVTDINDSLTQGLALLENPALAAVNAVEQLVENSATRIEGLQGAYDELLKRGATEQQLALQAENISIAGTIGQLELKSALKELSTAELSAVVSSNELSDSVKSLAQAQLNANTVLENAQAQKKLFDTAKSLSSTLSDLTGELLDLDSAGARFSDTTVFDISKALGETEVSDFALSLSTFSDGMVRGQDVANNYARSLSALRTRLDQGKITSIQYADSISLVSETLAEYSSYITQLFEEYTSAISDLSRELESAVSSLQGAASDLGEAISSGVESFATANNEILKIYDNTLSTIASSGNKLFDLQDRATSSYENAAKAVRDFEKENQLSGKTSAQVASELDAVKTKLQDALGAETLDFAGFVGISRLTSQQRSLEIELKALTKTESEYAQLIRDRDQAQEDLAFVETTILSLGERLIDTRLRESEVIQQTQQAAIDFISSNEELKTITELLSAANFNLNQRRFDEQSAIQKTVESLDTYIASLNALSAEFEVILSDDFLSEFVDTARRNAEIYYSSRIEDETELQRKIEEVGLSAGLSALELQNFARSFTEDFIPEVIASRNDILEIANRPITISDDELPYGAVLRAQLTDRFKDFNEDLIKYLDQDGLKQFYGENGIFKQFRDSLESNLVLTGFKPLIAVGGPLDNFNKILYLVNQSIDSLNSKAATVDITFELIETNIGTLVTALGSLSTGVQVAVASLLLEGDTISQASNALQTITTSVGTFATQLTALDIGSAAALIVTSIPEAISDFILNVTNIDLSAIPSLGITITDAILDSLDVNIFSTDLDGGPIGDIITAFNLVNSAISNIEITSVVDNISAEGVLSIVETFNIINSNVGSIESLAVINITGNRNQIQAIAQTFNAVNSTVGSIESLAVINLTGNINQIQAIAQTFNAVNSTVGSIESLAVINITGNRNQIQAIAQTFNAVNSTVGSIESLAVINLTGNRNQIQAIAIAFNAVNSTVGSINALQEIKIVGNANQIQSIAIAFNAVNSTVGSINAMQEIKIVGNANQIQAIAIAFNAVNSTVGSINALQEIKIIGSADQIQAIAISFNAVNSTVGSINALQEIKIVGSADQIQAIAIVFNAVNSTVGSINALQEIKIVGSASQIQALAIAFNAINSTVGSISALQEIKIVGSASQIQAIAIAFNAVNSTVGSINALEPIKIVGDRAQIIAVAKVFNSINSAVGLLNTVVAIDGETNTKINGLRTAITVSSDLISRLNAVGNISEYVNLVPTLVKGIVSAFTTVDSTKAQAFLNTAQSFNSIVSAITAAGALKAIQDYNAAQADSITKVGTLVTKFGDLSSTLATLTGTNGSVASLTSFFTNFASTIRTTWNNTVATFNTALNAAGVSVSITAPTGGTLSAADSRALSTIATNSQKYPKISGATYTTANFATGGFVSGPGTATSDSIPARLSDGEYVLKANTVSKLGKSMLDTLNATGDINTALASAGRRGDSLVAHINPAEAKALKQAGGSGSRNPQTGLLEFFSKDGGAIGKVFAEEEATKLSELYSGLDSSIITRNAAFNQISASMTGAFQTGRTITLRNYSKLQDGVPQRGADIMSQANYDKLANITAAAMDIGYYLSKSRNSGNRAAGSEAIISNNFDIPNSLDINGGTLFAGQARANPVGANLAGVNKDGGLAARFNQYLNTLAVKSIYPSANPVSPTTFSYDKTTIRKHIDELNKDRGNFTDFYMLRDLSKASLANNIQEYIPPAPTPGGGPGEFGEIGGGTVGSPGGGDSYGNDLRSSGGLIRGARDRVQSLLEPGEFVLRKQAVDKMGIDNAIRLNGNGNLNSDVAIEVNVINNGTAQTPVSEPKIRRENGKIVVDVILEDLRNNGPIKQQLRTIR